MMLSASDWFDYRYKILLRENVIGSFLNIGDGNGPGEDHCELVCGYQLGAVMANDSANSTSVTGTARTGPMTINWENT